MMKIIMAIKNRRKMDSKVKIEHDVRRAKRSIEGAISAASLIRRSVGQAAQCDP